MEKIPSKMLKKMSFNFDPLKMAKIPLFGGLERP
jgi:hypothetical protein